MKLSTAEERMAALLGLTTVERSHADDNTKVKTKTTKTTPYGFNAVYEHEIQKFREVQGLKYYLQAPALFRYKICRRPSCGESFLVSRAFVSFCSYNCIQKDLEESYGIMWNKGKDLEADAIDPNVWNGNEPIWIRNLDQIKKVLQDLIDKAENYEPPEA